MINQEKIMEKLEILLDHFEIDYKVYPHKINFPCPIHQGSKANGASILTNSAYGTGIFKCWSRGCHEEYGKTVLGLVRGILSTRQKKEFSYDQTIDWLEKFLNAELREDLCEEHAAKKQTTRLSWNFSVSNPLPNPNFVIQRDIVVSNLSIPSEYFIGRGYKKETLMKYDVGLCTNKTKIMYGRVVVPVYSDDHKHMIGCSGRTLKGQCMLCKKFHGEQEICPTSPFDEYKASKWVHSVGFNAQEYLYNFWYAKSNIEKTKTVVLVEGPGDVWKMEEAGIHNSLGLFGAYFNDGQAHKLEKLHIHNLVIATDNDEAGQQVRERIESKVGRLYNIYHVTPKAKDIGDTPIEEIHSLFSILPAGIYG